jgi:hypothetical protein
VSTFVIESSLMEEEDVLSSLKVLVRSRAVQYFHNIIMITNNKNNHNNNNNNNNNIYIYVYLSVCMFVCQGKLWSIDRMSFRGVILRGVKGGLGLLEVFKAIPLFESVPFPQVQRLCQSLREENYEPGERRGYMRIYVTDIHIHFIYYTMT